MIHNPNFKVVEFDHFKSQALNAVFIEKGLPQSERLVELNHIAIQQMQVLENIENKNILQ